MQWNVLAGWLVKTHIDCPTLRVNFSVSRGQCPHIYISIKFQEMLMLLVQYQILRMAILKHRKEHSAMLEEMSNHWWVNKQVFLFIY